MVNPAPEVDATKAATHAAVRVAPVAAVHPATDNTAAEIANRLPVIDSVTLAH